MLSHFLAASWLPDSVSLPVAPLQDAAPERPPRLSAASAPSIGILSSSFRLPGPGAPHPQTPHSAGTSAGTSLGAMPPLTDSISRVPLQRWDTDGPVAALVTAGGIHLGMAPPLPVCLGSFLPQGVAELFDAATFGLSPQECVLLDPQQRLLSECAAEALAGAEPAGGFGPDNRARFGVHVGASSLDYSKLCSKYHPVASAFSATGETPWRSLLPCIGAFVAVAVDSFVSMRCLPGMQRPCS